MRNLIERYMPLFEGEGAGTGGEPGGGGADPGGKTPAAAGGKDGGGKSQAAGGKEGGAPAPYYPAGMADEMKGSDDRATIDGLYNRVNGLRTKLNEIPKAPDKADAYTLQLDDKLKEKTGDLDNDPLFKKVREFAHAEGFSQGQYQNFMSKVLGAMDELGAYAPNLTDEQLAGQMIDPKLTDDNRKQALTAAAERITNARSWVDGLPDDSGYTPGERAELTLMTQTPGGLALVERFMANNTFNGVAAGGSSQQGQSMTQVINSRMKDPRGIPGDPKFDKDFAAETRRLMQQNPAAIGKR